MMGCEENFAHGETGGIIVLAIQKRVTSCWPSSTRK